MNSKAGAKKVWDTVKSIGEAIVGVGKEIDYKYLGISTTALGLYGRTECSGNTAGNAVKCSSAG